MHAASASARRLTPEERAAAGIGENLIRVSVGLEDPDDVAEDLLQALRGGGPAMKMVDVGGKERDRARGRGHRAAPDAARHRAPHPRRGGWRRATCSPRPGSPAVMAAKRTPDLVPLCHPIALTGVTVEVTLDDGRRCTSGPR